MNLNAAAGIIESRENKVKNESVQPQYDIKQQMPMMQNTKNVPNVAGQYDMMRNQASKY